MFHFDDKEKFLHHHYQELTHNGLFLSLLRTVKILHHKFSTNQLTT